MSVSFQSAENSQAQLSDIRCVGLSDSKFTVLAEKIERLISDGEMQVADSYIGSLTVEKIKEEYNFEIEVSQDEMHSIQSTAFQTLFQAAVLNGQDDLAQDIFCSKMSNNSIRDQAVIMKIALVALFERNVGSVENLVLRAKRFIPLVVDQIDIPSERDSISFYLVNALARFLPNPNISAPLAQ